LLRRRGRNPSVYASVVKALNSRLIDWHTEMLAFGTGVVTTMAPLECVEEQAAIV
jgi:hypothetical protein